MLVNKCTIIGSVGIDTPSTVYLVLHFFLPFFEIPSKQPEFFSVH